jgi:hypothetical protein
MVIDHVNINGYLIDSEGDVRKVNHVRSPWATKMLAFNKITDLVLGQHVL